jgi:hypothetical protein
VANQKVIGIKLEENQGSLDLGNWDHLSDIDGYLRDSAALTQYRDDYSLPIYQGWYTLHSDAVTEVRVGDPADLFIRFPAA